MEASVSRAHLHGIPWQPGRRKSPRNFLFQVSALQTNQEMFSMEDPRADSQCFPSSTHKSFPEADCFEPNQFKTKKIARKPQRTKQPGPGLKDWESLTGKHVKKKQVGGFVSSVLEALQSSDNVTEVLEQLCGTLEGRDKSQILKEQRDWSRAVEVFNWFRKQESYRPNVYLYNILFKTLGRHRKWELVQKYWSEMEKEKVFPTNVTYSTMVDVHGRAGMKEEALFYYKHMKDNGVQPDEVMVSTFVNLQRRFGDLKTAEEAFWSLFTGNGNRPENPETYNTMITLYGEHKRFTDASRVFTEMMKSGVQLTTVTFNAMIHIYGKIGRVKEAEQLVDRMAQRKCYPDVATYNSLVEMYVRNGSLEQAFGCLERMENARISPDQVTYRTLINAYASAGLAWKAETLVQRMEASGFYIDHGIYTVMISTYIKARNVSKAESVFSFMRSRGNGALDVGTYVAAMDAYAEQGLLPQAKNILELSKEDGIKSSSVYNVMIKAYGLYSMYTEAVAVYESMEVDGVRPNEATYNTVVQLSCKGRLLELLQKVLPSMKSAGFKPSLPAVSSIISFYADVGRVKEAEKMFQELTVKPDAICYSALLNAYAEAGFAKEAQRTLVEIKEAGFVPDTIMYTSMMKLYTNLGMIEEAERIYKDITRLAPDMFAANAMVSLYIKSGLFKEAEQMFRTLQRGDPGVNEVTCTMMLKLYKETGMIEQGLYVARLMENKFLLKDVTAFNELIAMYAKAGLMREAFRGIKEMRDVGIEPNRSTYSCFEEALEKAGMPKECIQRLEGGSSRLQMMAVLAPLYAQAGMTSEAVEIAFGIKRASEEEEGEEELDVNAYNAMIYAFGKAGKLDLALKMYAQMQGRGVELNEATYGSVIAAYGKAGLLEGVGRMFRRLKENGYQPSVATYKTVIEVYKEAGRMDLASLVSQELHFAQYIRGGMVASDEDELL